MKIRKLSPLTGQYRVMDLPISEEQLKRWESNRELIQDVMPDLTPEQREFLMTGYTSEDWGKMFPKCCGGCDWSLVWFVADVDKLRCNNAKANDFEQVVAEDHVCPHWQGG